VEVAEMELGQKLRAIRRGKDITLQQVADATGLSKSYISQIEAGRANPTMASITAHAKHAHLGVFCIAKAPANPYTE
jgi:transcriptional regulator with XRE-family HTH domain